MTEERRLRVFENWVMRIFGRKRGKVREAWRKLHNEELNDLYSSSHSGHKIWKNEMGWACSSVQTGFWWRNLRERDHLEDNNKIRKPS